MTTATDDRLAMANARMVLSVLRASGLRSPFGVDLDTAEELWAVKLAAFDVDVLMQVVNDWTDDEDADFPTVAQIASLADRYAKRRAAIDRGMEHPIAGQVCPTCDGVGFEVVSDADETAVKPCGTCRRRMAELHSGGHFMREHVASGGCVDCRPKRRGKR